MKLKILNLICLSSLALIPTTLISTACFDDNQESELAKETVGEHIWEYDAKVASVEDQFAHKEGKNFKNFACKVAVGINWKLKEYYKDYLMLDFIPVEKQMHQYEYRTIYKNELEPVIALIITKEIAKEIGLIQDIGPNWKDALKDFRFMRDNVHVPWARYSFDKETKTLSISASDYKLRNSKEIVKISSGIKIILDKNKNNQTSLSFNFNQVKDEIDDGYELADIKINLMFNKIINL
ncbi:hypothetical protein JN00_0389 [Metamycoplasma subdolum]|uniref:Lipoprotein n=1 Tax=Metamycoplasma subdolum TaxID=92407 RepID=A0A3L9ZYV4_9BACT|nr:hypothetical protein [Metamycoplasma subdolum]RMA77547.1 hypothetical protein JN00_0389 [Metamycoplasma subdolum]WPB50341.1 hypothetical protein R9C05_01895 [Metamycoplasma subdolum]